MIEPYIRLARLRDPIGTWLLLFPCWWSYTLASPEVFSPTNYILFTFGAIVMRAAGCVLNDLVDRNIDKKVLRTSRRPIATKEISIPHAIIFLSMLLFLGFLILIQFNQVTILLGISSLILILIYPFMKRITFWPQAFLGLTFNWGALIGWTSVHAELEVAPILLYCAGFFWTIGYDTIYALQDKDDDTLIGIKSTARKFGNKTKRWLFCFFSLSIFLFVLCGHIENLSWSYFLGLTISFTHLVWQIKTLDINDPKDCSKKFKSNRDFAFIIFLSIISSKI